MAKQISLTIPDILFETSKDYYEALGFRSLQEFILDLMRRKLILEKIQRYKEIEQKMKNGRGVKRLKQKEAVNYLRGL